MPIKDEKQDWKLVKAKENDTHTILQFRRKLNTCDDKDMIIDVRNYATFHCLKEILTNKTKNHNA